MTNPCATNSAAPIRIVIADDHPLFRKGLVTALGFYTQIRIIGEAGTGKELVQAVQDKQPDIALTDIKMPGMCGVEATAIIKRKHPQTNVIALSMHDSEEVVMQMLEAGAKGYLLKNSEESEILEAIHTVSSNGTHYCSTASNKMVRVLARSRTSTLGRQVYFNERDMQIIRLLCQQRCSKEIAAALCISPRAVDGARERIQEKVGARNMIGIALYAIKHGIFSLD